MSYHNTFRNRSVFVTGHTGFKGSWLCLWLHRLGARVSGYALEPPSQPNNFVISDVAASLEAHHVADIRDAERLTAAVRQAQPDLVMHLAAETVVRRGYEIPRQTFDVNVIGTACVLDAVRSLGRPCAVLAITSDKCYENNEQVWGYRECDPFGEHDPYGASKGAAEILIRAYRHSFFPTNRLGEHGIKLASARAGNVVGGGDWTRDGLVPDIVRCLSAGRPVAIRRPNARRPWQHVLQALDGYLTLSATLLASDDPSLCSGWNIGPLPGEELTVRDIVERFLDEWGVGEWVNASSPADPPESGTLRLSVDKATQLLGWRPRWTLAETLRRTADWYRRYYREHADMQAVCLSQIADYESAFETGGLDDEAPESAAPHGSCGGDARHSLSEKPAADGCVEV